MVEGTAYNIRVLHEEDLILNLDYTIDTLYGDTFETEFLHYIFGLALSQEEDPAFINIEV